MWKNFSFTTKIFVGFVILILLSSAGLMYVDTDVKEIDAVTGVTFNEYDNALALLSAESAHYIWVNNVANYIIKDITDPLTVVKDGRECAFGKWYYSDERRTLEREIPAIKTMLSSLEDPHLILHKSAIDIEKAVQSNNANAAFNIYETVTLPQLEIIRKNLTLARDTVNQTISNFKLALIKDIKETEQRILFIMIGLLVFSVVLALMISKSVTGPLKYLVSYAQDVAHGKLIQPELNQKDEIGRLSSALGVMVTTLQEHIGEAEKIAAEALKKEEEANIHKDEAQLATEKSEASHKAILNAIVNLEKVIETIHTESHALVGQINDAEHNAESIAIQIAESVNAMKEMVIASSDVAVNASNTSIVSSDARTVALSGLDTVDKMMESIEEVQQQSHVLKTDMADLSSHAQAINTIMAVISDIADQTNLLALNAAIEAARAGEAGRGFAVVADEVRKLAEKTMHSTADVSNAITLIQKSVSHSIIQADTTVATVANTAELSDQSGKALKEIVHKVDKTVEQVHVIAVASEEQSATTEHINLSLSTINQKANNSAHIMTQAKEAVTKLAKQAEILTELVRQMKH